MKLEIRPSIFHRPLRVVLTCGLLLLAVDPVQAGMSDMVEAIRTSEFRFLRSDSDVPFIPNAWLQEQFYPNTQFKPSSGHPPSVTASESSLSQGLIMPAYVAKQDMLLVGEDIQLDSVNVRSGPYQDQNVLSLTPAAGWLHQFKDADMVGVFAAPIFSQELNHGDTWGTQCYAGVVGVHWQSDTLQWLYGGVYEYSFGQNFFYPYLGALWLPTPKLSVSLVIPWPSITYAPTERWLISLGITPGGSAWVKRDGNETITQTLSSWNLTAGGGYRIYDRLWLFAGAGVAGFRSFAFGDSGGSRLEARPSPVFTLALQYRL